VGWQGDAVWLPYALEFAWVMAGAWHANRLTSCRGLPATNKPAAQRTDYHRAH